MRARQIHCMPRMGSSVRALFLRCCNWVLSHNVVLPAWMHVGSKVQNLGIARIGDTLSARARVTQNYEHKGHKFVEVDALVWRTSAHRSHA